MSELTQEQTAEIDRLARRGAVTAERLMEASRSPKSAFYRFVGWHLDDAVAAAKYRLERARLALSLHRLRLAEADQRVISKIKSDEEQERLRGMVASMEDAGARRLINYADGEGYKDVVRELAEGRESMILGQLVAELSQFVRTRAAMHPDFHARMQKVLCEVRQEFSTVTEEVTA